jgi:hypothetical protein
MLDDHQEDSVCAHSGDIHVYKSPTLQESIPYLQPELVESGKENFVGTIAGCDEHDLRRWFRKNNPLEEVVVLRQTTRRCSLAYAHNVSSGNCMPFSRSLT